METIRPNLTPNERIKLLKQDGQFKILVGVWSRITKSPQRPEFWLQIKKRRSDILNAPDPQSFIHQSNLELERILEEKYNFED